MHKLVLFVGALLFAGTAYSQLSTQYESEQLLNSERIFQQFGSYGIELINQENDFRQTSLYSESEQGRVTRTFATVKFLEPVNPGIEPLHELILKGSSIGSTFKADGWHIDKYGLLIDELEIKPANSVFGLMHLEKPQRLALHLYLFSISKPSDPAINYALIAELHHPDYMSIHTLHEIYEDQMDLSRGEGLQDQVSSLLGQIKNL
jgi:hypothetical protein